MSTDSVSHHQSAALEALARHLHAHPQLAPVNVFSLTDGIELQVSTWTRTGALDNAPALVAWAESLPEHRITFKVIDGTAYVSVAAALEGIPVLVWSTVPDLAPHLEDPDAFTLAHLRAFATAGHLPGRAD